MLYRPRWSMECTFASLEVRGFDLERTGIIHSDRLERVFGLVTLGWASCLRIGVWLQAQVPIKVKAHARSAMRCGTARSNWVTPRGGTCPSDPN
ncbi:hypothetical protein GCM10008960_41610 [Deinococcus sedimenti]|uniref:Transposase DDE domain-containing protein n=1 Tax=Deinococcus sedimenti TaxID=1867090 RepID=A0ABQ2S9K3_9DEIO|nr:hypothetical protein GCM10008960_41610 [Deinococcus sedimenti]